MAAPTQLNVVITQNNSGTVTTSTVTVPIPAALQTLDSGNSSGQGQAASQTGVSSVDMLVRAIFRAGVFTDGAGNWYSAAVIQKITAQ
jgi:hypothetical protein